VNRDIRPFTLLLGLSWTLAISIVGGLVVGVLFDRFMGTSPIGLLVFSLIGILSGSLQVYRQVSAAIAAEAEEQNQRKRELQRKRESLTKRGPQTSDYSEPSDSKQKEED